jgi:hypothetical protein
MAILQPLLAVPGTVYVCPGRYFGNYTTSADVTLIGAGDGDDPQVDTILSGPTPPTSLPVVSIPSNRTVELRQVRITGGQALNTIGGGIQNGGTTLTLRNCTVSGNSATRNDDAPAEGGGIFNDAVSHLVMVDCTVSGNAAAHTGNDSARGGGIMNRHIVELTRCRIVDNTAKDEGGGISQSSNVGFATLTDCEVTQNKIVPAGPGGSGINNSSFVGVTLVNSFVWDNTPDPQCVGNVTGSPCGVPPP